MEYFVKTNTLLLPNDHILCTSNMFFDGSEDGISNENVGINPCTYSDTDRQTRERSDTVRDEMV